ncbi:DUF4232 domain-containing protein [Dactylosporangium sp. NPDC051485]|uniref:DUF4232 domain-containing protein n=1 Tax=Dactylosporangium sp. NPDC051485 TaxID=3154846 RepID=UPI0034310FAF
MTEPDDRFEGWLERHRVEPLGPVPGAYDRIARTARRRRVGRVAVAAAAVVVGITGITGLAYRIVAGPGPVLPPGTSASPSRAAPASPDPASPPAPASAGSQSTLTTSPSVPPTRCHTGDLNVTAQGARGGGAAGSEYTWLVFTNISTRPCSLYGFPGVSWVTAASGQQVNDPTARMTELKPVRIVLAPQGVAHAEVRYGHPGAFEPDCHAVHVAGFRVYPPDETTSVFVPLPAQACSAKGVNVGAVSPVTAGLDP